jgi:hypothetical protein
MMVGGGAYEVLTPPRRAWRERWRDWWFPKGPTPVIEGETRTFISTTVLITISWRDRLRILVSGRAALALRTYTEVEVTAPTTKATFVVRPPW